MAKITSTPTDLTQLLESVSMNEVGSAAEQALSNILGVNVPLDASVEGAAGFFAQNSASNLTTVWSRLQPFF